MKVLDLDNIKIGEKSESEDEENNEIESRQGKSKSERWREQSNWHGLKIQSDQIRRDAKPDQADDPQATLDFDKSDFWQIEEEMKIRWYMQSTWGISGDIQSTWG